MEVSDMSTGKYFFSQHLWCTFLPCGDCYIRESQPLNLTVVWFLLCNSVAVTLAFQKALPQ